jgi:hypothetical protein
MAQVESHYTHIGAFAGALMHEKSREPTDVHSVDTNPDLLASTSFQAVRPRAPSCGGDMQAAVQWLPYRDPGCFGKAANRSRGFDAAGVTKVLPTCPRLPRLVDGWGTGEAKL